MIIFAEKPSKHNTGQTGKFVGLYRQIQSFIHNVDIQIIITSNLHKHSVQSPPSLPSVSLTERATQRSGISVIVRDAWVEIYQL